MPTSTTTTAPKHTLPDLPPAPPIDQVGVHERVARLATRSIKKDAKVHALKLALSMVDLTTLAGADSPGKVRQLCTKAKHLASPDLPGCDDLPRVAAVCVYPTMVALAKQELQGTGIHLASVATGFPTGQYPLPVRLDDTRRAVDAGADEIDMVISRGRFLAGDLAYVYDEIAQVKEACGGSGDASGGAHLKVILETGELSTYDNVRRASDLAMHAGADFIKTSTGTISPAATPQVTLVVLQAIADFHRTTGNVIGMKPAGGIKTAKQALQDLVIVRETLGQHWLHPDRFRFGASSLANDLLMQIAKQASGQYQSPDYFSLD